MGRWMKKTPYRGFLVTCLAAVIEVSSFEVAEPAGQAPVQDQKIRPPEQGCYLGVFPGWGELEDGVRAGPARFYRAISSGGSSCLQLRIRPYVCQRRLQQILRQELYPLLHQEVSLAIDHHAPADILTPLAGIMGIGI